MDWHPDAASPRARPTRGIGVTGQYICNNRDMVVFGKLTGNGQANDTTEILSIGCSCVVPRSGRGENTPGACDGNFGHFQGVSCEISVRFNGNRGQSVEAAFFWQSLGR